MEVIILVLIITLLLVLFLTNTLLFLVSKLFKIETVSYKKSLIALIASGSTGIITGVLFHIINVGFPFNILVSIIASFFVFHYFYKKYYLNTWTKSLGIYVVFYSFFMGVSIALSPVTGLIIYNVRQHVFTPFIVSGDTMSPAYNNGDYLLVNKSDNSFERDDVIVFRSPLDSNKFLIKRIIGLPGEKIDIADGNISINGNILNESYISPGIQGIISLTLEEDQYYVLGDNHNASLDSRRLGPITKSLIQGKILYNASRFTNFIK